MKKGTIKIPKLFTAKYTDKDYAKKILGKLYVPADKEFVESLFTTTVDPKKGATLHTIDRSRVTDKKEAKRLARIAKDIKQQKGRINVVNVAAAVACVLALVLTLVVFRNQIARAVIVSSMEGAFGAKCEIAKLDINPLDTHFTIDGLAVANRKKPMTNLFEIGHLELHFNLLELTRGKFVTETVEITGVTWSTARKTDGSLPPRAEKKYQKKLKSSKPNPVQAKLEAELAKVKSGVSVDSGLSAVKDQLDPAKYIEREKASLQSPAVVDEIKSSVPGFTAKWQSKTDDVRAKADAAMADAKAVAAIKPNELKTVADAQAALATVNKANDTLKTSASYAESTAKDIAADSATVKALSAKAQTAFNADSARLKALASSVKSVNLDSGMSIVSGVFKTFIINALGEYYPMLDKGLSMAGSLQSGAAKKKDASLQKKASVIARLPGRNFTFASDTLPQFLMRNIALSAKDDAIALAASAGVKNVTNDQDRLGVPMTFDAAVKTGAMSEKVSGAVDFRSSAAERLDAKFDVGGYRLAIDSGNVPGVPSLKGALGSKGTLTVAPDGTVTIDAAMNVSDAKTSVPSFDPAFLNAIYADVLSDVKTVDLDVHAVISPDRDVSVTVKTGADAVIRAAIQKRLAQKVAEVKGEILKYGDNWLAEQKKSYADEIAKFDAVSGKARSAADDVKNSQKIIDAKKAEIEKRIRDIAGGSADKAASKASSSVKDAVGKIKKPF